MKLIGLSDAEWKDKSNGIKNAISYKSAVTIVANSRRNDIIEWKINTELSEHVSFTTLHLILTV